nr:MAG TPA: hypothetical protein [Caudoviricetes sp.]
MKGLSTSASSVRQASLTALFMPEHNGLLQQQRGWAVRE